MYYLYEAFSGEVFDLGVSIGVPLQSLGDPCSASYTTVEGDKAWARHLAALRDIAADSKPE